MTTRLNPNSLFLDKKWWLLALITAIVAGILTSFYSLWIVAAILGVGVVCVVLRSPRHALVVALILEAIGQFGRIPPGAASGAILLLDLIVGTLFLQWLMAIAIVRPAFSWKPPYVTWIGFILVALIGFLFSPFHLSKPELLQNGFYLLRLVVYSGLAFEVPTFFRTETEQFQLLRWLLWTGMAVVMGGFVQLYLLPDIGFLAKYGWDPHVGRLVSTFLDPNYLGGFFAVVLALLLSRITQAKDKQATIWLWGAVILTLIASVLTYSRSGYLAVGIVVLIFGLRYSWRLMLIAIICVIPLVLFIPRISQRIIGGLSVDQTAQDRIESWQNAWAISQEFGLFGIGYNNYQNAQVQLGFIGENSTSKANAGSDSSLLNVLATTGGIGLGLFLATVFLVLRECMLILKKSQKSAAETAALVLVVSAPALFVHSFFVNSLFYPFLMLFLALLVGLVLCSQSSTV